MISDFQNMLTNPHLFSLSAENHLISSNNSISDTHSCSLLYNLSVLKDKLHQIQSLVNIFISDHQDQTLPESFHPPSMAVAAMNSLIQEVIMTASSMLFTSQQMGLEVNSSSNDGTVENLAGVSSTPPITGTDEPHWYHTAPAAIYNNGGGSEVEALDIVELDASNLLAKYTHHCRVCGKGFKRDANLRMHMRAHGDEYKTSAALSNPMKSSRERECNLSVMGRKYSCPQEGCRWNRKHVKFQPLKSLICVKNHYKRSHCPKIYVCKRCNQKQFSVLSDLRTHEKHCGSVKWLCSCGTTFSRKDKLMGHVALFVGHSPAVKSTANLGKLRDPNR